MFSGELNISNTVFSNSRGFYGGAIYIETKGYSLINIFNVIFNNTISAFNSLNSKGGAIYINAADNG